MMLLEMTAQDDPLTAGTTSPSHVAKTKEQKMILLEMNSQDDPWTTGTTSPSHGLKEESVTDRMSPRHRSKCIVLAAMGGALFSSKPSVP